MAKHINHSGGNGLMTYAELKQKLLAIAQTRHLSMGDSIPDETYLYWRIGQTLAWHAEDLLEDLALELRRAGKSWQARDLAKMAQLFLHCPTVERLLRRCSNRKQASRLDELLNAGK